MSLTNKALWTIERHSKRPLTLREIAEVCGVSAYHLAHAFGASTGLSVMQYVRGRRLTEAARALAAGAPNILDLALDSGYESHEAFSRAFRAQFGVTPEFVRRKASTEDLPMIDAMKLPGQDDVELAPPLIVAGDAVLAIGLSARHTFDKTQAIAAQWQKFMGLIAEIPNRTPAIPLGISTDMDEDGNFIYVCATEVTKFSDLPDGLVQIRIPARRYAVFTHRGHVSKIGATYAAIGNRYHDQKPADGPWLERHLETFDPRTGLGGVEIWIPIGDAA